MSQFLNTHFNPQTLRGADPTRLDINEAVATKWDDAFDGEQKLTEQVKDHTKRRAVTQMLEYQYQGMGGDMNESIDMREQNIDEAEGATSNIAGTNAASFDPILIKMVRKVAPSLIHHDLVGVQPMTGPTGLIFAMKSFYVNKDGTKGNEVQPEGIAGVAGAPDVGFSGGFKTTTQDNISDRNANMYDVAQLEKLGTVKSAITNAGTTDVAVMVDPATIWPEMTFSIERQSVTAQARALKASYTDELVQDLKSVHGLNARDELANILSTEIISEQNRELVMILANQAKQGCQNTATKGVFNLDVDADGRWAIEKFKGLLLQINREAHTIALETRRGVGNTIISHSDVVAALDMAGIVDKSIVTGNLNIDGVGVTYAGMLSGRFKVYVDPYAGIHYMLIGFKGANQYDAGAFYCPYVALQFMEARNSESFQPSIGMKTRYGFAVNPMLATYQGGQSLASTKGKNPYYRLFTITGI